MIHLSITQKNSILNLIDNDTSDYLKAWQDEGISLNLIGKDGFGKLKAGGGDLDAVGLVQAMYSDEKAYEKEQERKKAEAAKKAAEAARKKQIEEEKKLIFAQRMKVNLENKVNPITDFKDYGASLNLKLIELESKEPENKEPAIIEPKIITKKSKEVFLDINGTLTDMAQQYYNKAKKITGGGVFPKTSDSVNNWANERSVVSTIEYEEDQDDNEWNKMLDNSINDVLKDCKVSKKEQEEYDKEMYGPWVNNKKKRDELDDLWLEKMFQNGPNIAIINGEVVDLGKTYKKKGVIKLPEAGLKQFPWLKKKLEKDYIIDTEKDNEKNNALASATMELNGTTYRDPNRIRRGHKYTYGRNRKNADCSYKTVYALERIGYNLGHTMRTSGTVNMVNSLGQITWSYDSYTDGDISTAELVEKIEKIAQPGNNIIMDYKRNNGWAKSYRIDGDRVFDHNMPVVSKDENGHIKILDTYFDSLSAIQRGVMPLSQPYPGRAFGHLKDKKQNYLGINRPMGTKNKIKYMKRWAERHNYPWKVLIIKMDYHGALGK